MNTSNNYQWVGNQALKSVLVIDDETLVRESIAVYLEDSGYQVFQAADGQQGLSLFCEFQPDAVLCDLRMPGMDGMEVLRQMTELSPSTPVIIVSGAGQIQDVVESLRLGALDYLVKPVTDLRVLENALVNALTRTELEQENAQYKEELEKANAELEHHLEILQKDQDAGRRAQLQLLPEPVASLGEFKFQHVIIPSLNLSGDFIDHFAINDRYLGFYIADVSGHGSAAAFVTMMLKSLFNQPLRDFKQGANRTIIEPHLMMEYLNLELIHANLGKHITLFYGVIDQQTMRLHYTVAGQYPAPVLYNRGQYEHLLDGGFPVGLFEWASFEKNERPIGPDFKLLMVSDGWLELLEQTDTETGEAFLLSYVKQHKIDIPTLMVPVKKYRESNVPDDITIFVIERERGHE